jgi:hypothetical protein
MRRVESEPIVKGTAAQDALRAANTTNLIGKTVIDATNPLADATPINGVLGFFTNLDESSMECLQREFGGAHFVKAFNSVGSACMVNPQFKSGKPTAWTDSIQIFHLRHFRGGFRTEAPQRYRNSGAAISSSTDIYVASV